MKAVRIYSFGGPEVLQVEDVPRPEPGEGEVLIRVRAASVNPVDYKMRQGGYRRAKIELPATLGRDVSGTVEAVGPGAGGVRVGEDVYAFLGARGGGYAEYAIARAGEVARKPARLDEVHAAAVPLAGETAWQALFDHGRLEPGERVLIHGAAGGVGHLAVQFAKVRGARVIATGRGGDAELLRTLGADEVIDADAERFEDRVRDIDLVIDLVGGEIQQRSWPVLKDGGRLVSTLAEPSPDEARAKRAKGVVFMAEPRAEQLAEMARLFDDGKVRVEVETVLPLAEARRAHERLERQLTRGKVVLTTDAT